MKLPVLLAVAALAVCLTGCSHAQTDATPSATSETAEAAATATPAATPATSAEPVCAEVGTILPETADAGRSYVDETLFIGDSNTARYLLYANETGTAFTSLNNNIGVVSMGVGSITSLKCEKFKGSSAMYTVPDAVAMLKPKRIIICYGTNNLSGSSTDATNYIKTYLQGLQAIQTAWPYCDIIVSAIPPLDRQRENTNLTMTQVDAYNAALVQMCEENGFKFLNSAEVLRDDATGWAKKDYTLSDGVHLSKEAVTAYFTYVRTHAYAAEDRRPQPLGTIPTPDGVPANLINKDPIAVRGAKVPLEFVAANGGKLSGTTSQLVKKGGTAAAVTAVPDEGFVFAGWTASSGGSYSSATISFTMPQNADAGGVVLTANFKADAHEHNYAEIEDTRVNPTCTNNGSAKYKCTICGEVIEKELPALGHDWDGGVVSNGVITFACRREGCGETRTEAVQATPTPSPSPVPTPTATPEQHVHNFQLVSDTATCAADGVKTYQCSCGEQMTDPSPATGNHSWQLTGHTDPQRPKNSTLIRRFLPYMAKYRGVLAFDLFCAALTTLCDIALPSIMRTLTNTVSAAALTVDTVLRLAALYFVLRIIDGAASYFMSGIGHIMGVHIETDMRRDAFDHLLRLDHTYYNNTKVGQIMGRITNDLFDVTEFAHHCPEEFFIAGIKIAASFVILCQASVPLTLVVFACVPLMGVVSVKLNRKLRERFRQQRFQIGELNATIEDSLLGQRVVKAFAAEDMEREKFAQGNRDFEQIKTLSYHAMAAFNTSTRLFDGLMYFVVILAGGLSLVYGAISAGDLVAYVLYVSTLIATIRRIVEFAEQFQRGMTGIERFAEIMDTPVTIADAPDAKPLVVKDGGIDFDDVSFEYPDDHNKVLRHVDLHIRPGENVALVGPSGGGKTTLCNLIPRFYDVTGGKILIDGQDVRGVTLHSLRGAIGVVQQDVYLFSGTVAENIAYGRPGATRAEIEEAARLAGADAFVRALKDGYDTYVGERGVKLSGGQKQRLAIARVFLKNPRILLLDEATSALDNESEILVGQSLDKLAKGRTTLTIAHRLTTIKNADRILVLGRDGIEEEGSHDELLAKQGVYYRLWNGLVSGETL